MEDGARCVEDDSLFALDAVRFALDAAEFTFLHWLWVSGNQQAAFLHSPRVGNNQRHQAGHSVEIRL